MTPDEALRELKSLTERAATIGGGSDATTPRAVTSTAVARPSEPAADAQTPLYDHLMAMVEATAEENSYVADVDANQLAADRRRRLYTIVHFVAGVIVAVAVGRAVFVWVMRPSQPPAVIAATDIPRSEDRVAEEKVPATAEPPAADVPAEPFRPAAEPSSPAPAADDGERTVISADAGTAAAANTGTTAAAAASPAEPPPPAAPAAPTVTTEPSSASPGAQAAPADEPVAPPAPLEAAAPPDPQPPAAADPEPAAPPAPAAVAASEPPPPANEAPPPEPPALQTGSIGRSDDAAAEVPEVPEAPVATRTAWIVRAVRMRSGPNNGDAVLATIGKGRPVEVIGCRAWCEVIYAGQRGWVYKGFVGESPAP